MAAPSSPASPVDAVLRACVLDYLEKHGFRDSAAALRSEVASNPNLPTANVPFDLPAAFLHEWFRLFWESWNHISVTVQKGPLRPGVRQAIALSTSQQMTTAGIMPSLPTHPGGRPPASIDTPQSFSGPAGRNATRPSTLNVASQSIAGVTQPSSVGSQLAFAAGVVNGSRQNPQSGVILADAVRGNIQRRDGVANHAINHSSGANNTMFAGRGISNATPPPHPHIPDGLSRHQIQQQGVQGIVQTQQHPHLHAQNQEQLRQRQPQQAAQQQPMRIGKNELMGSQGRGNSSSETSALHFHRSELDRSSGKPGEHIEPSDMHSFQHTPSTLANSARKRPGPPSTGSASMLGSNSQGLPMSNKQSESNNSAKRQRTDLMNNVANTALNGMRVPHQTLVNRPMDMGEPGQQSGGPVPQRQQLQHALRQNQPYTQQQQHFAAGLEASQQNDNVALRNQQQRLQHPGQMQQHPSQLALQQVGQQQLPQQMHMQQQQQQQQQFPQQHLHQLHLRHQRLPQQIQQQQLSQHQMQQQQPQNQHPQSQSQSQTSQHPLNQQQQQHQQAQTFDQQRQHVHSQSQQQSSSPPLHQQRPQQQQQRTQGHQPMLLHHQQSIKYIQQRQQAHSLQQAQQKMSAHAHRSQQQGQLPAPSPSQLQRQGQLPQTQKEVLQKGQGAHRGHAEDHTSERSPADFADSQPTQDEDKAETSNPLQRHMQSNSLMHAVPKQQSTQPQTASSHNDQSGTPTLQTDLQRNGQRPPQNRLASHSFQVSQRQSASPNPASSSNTQLQDRRSVGNQSFHVRSSGYNQSARGPRGKLSQVPQNSPEPNCEDETYIPNGDENDDGMSRVSVPAHHMPSGAGFDMNAPMMQAGLSSDAAIVQVTSNGMAFIHDNQYAVYSARQDGEVANSGASGGMFNSTATPTAQASSMVRRSDDEGIDMLPGKRHFVGARASSSLNQSVSRGTGARATQDGGMAEPSSQVLSSRVDGLENDLRSDHGGRNGGDRNLNPAPATSANDCSDLAGNASSMPQTSNVVNGSGIDVNASNFDPVDSHTIGSSQGKISGQAPNEEDNGSVRSDRQGSNSGPSRSGTASQRSNASGTSTGRGGRRKSGPTKGSQVTKRARAGAKGSAENGPKAASAALRLQSNTADRLASMEKSLVSRQGEGAIVGASHTNIQLHDAHPFSIAGAANGPSLMSTALNSQPKYDGSRISPMTAPNSQPAVFASNGVGVASAIGGLYEGFGGYGNIDSLDVGQTDVNRSSQLPPGEPGPGAPGDGLDLCVKGMGVSVANGLDIGDPCKGAGMHNGLTGYGDVFNYGCGGSADEENALEITGLMDMNRINGLGRMNGGLDLDGSGFEDDAGILGGGDPGTVFDINLTPGNTQGRE